MAVSADIICRFIAEQLSRAVGQQVVVENRPGSRNVIGTQAAARSAPNGYTFFFAGAAALVTDPYTFKSLPYDPIKDFAVVSKVAEVTFMVMAHREPLDKARAGICRRTETLHCPVGIALARLPGHQCRRREGHCGCCTRASHHFTA
jgi:hypothetical protein